MTAAAWTRWYWPAAVTLSVAALIVAHRYTGPVVAGGAVLLGGPESYFLVRRQFASTLSDWCWGVLHVTRRQPLSQWSAVHFLALWCYLTVAVRVVAYMLTLGYWPGGLSAGLAVWLTWHLFGRWWR